jgi:hypothetical protein
MFLKQSPNAPNLSAERSHAVGRKSKSKPASTRLSREQVEALVEDDPALVPTGPSAFDVEDWVLEPEELTALLEGLAAQLELTDRAADEAGALNTAAYASQPTAAGNAEAGFPHWPAGKGVGYESDASPVGRGGRHPKLSPLAWLFPNHAGTGRPARNQQGHHLRARGRFGKKAGHPPRQAQGSLFGD